MTAFLSINLEDKVIFEKGSDDVIPVDFATIANDVGILISKLVKDEEQGPLIVGKPGPSREKSNQITPAPGPKITNWVRAIVVGKPHLKLME